MKETESQRRRRLINLGELIALAALVVSALGLWINWKSSSDDGKPSTVVEQRQPIALTLRGRAEDDGKFLEISPVENSHALESLTVTVKGADPVEVGSDGVLRANSLEPALKQREEDKGVHSVPLRIQARYVEMGKDKTATGSYQLRYRWEGGGLFGGRSLRFVSLSRG